METVRKERGRARRVIICEHRAPCAASCGREGAARWRPRVGAGRALGPLRACTRPVPLGKSGPSVCESVVMRPLSPSLSLRLSTPGRRSSAAAAGLVRSCRRPSLAVPVRSPATIDRPARAAARGRDTVTVHTRIQPNDSHSRCGIDNCNRLFRSSDLRDLILDLSDARGNPHLSPVNALAWAGGPGCAARG